MKSALSLLTAALLAGVVLPARASVVPPGAILDLAASTSDGLAPSAYTYYQVTFKAQYALTVVSFAFQDVPSYLSFDDASVTRYRATTNLLSDPGFETSRPGSGNPMGGWSLLVQPAVPPTYATVFSGEPDSTSVTAHSGHNFWRDGTFGGFDGLAQAVPTQVGRRYTVGFWLAADTADNFSSPDLDVLVYAGKAIPQGMIVTTSPLPEPYSVALLAPGLLGIGFIRRLTQPR